MAIIETKFDVGDVVYISESSYETKYMECPDCLGAKKVQITFADKRIEEINCYTCRTYGYPEYSTGFIEFTEYAPKVKKGEVSSVEFMDGKIAYKVRFGYFIGDNGSRHPDISHFSESNLFFEFEEEEALAQAIQKVEKSTAIELEHTFKKKGNFAERLEKSNLGYTRQSALEEERELKRWLKAIKGK